MAYGCRQFLLYNFCPSTVDKLMKKNSEKMFRMPVSEVFVRYASLEMKMLSLWFRASQFYTTIIQQDAAVRSKFYFTAALLYMFRVLSTPIIRSTLTVSTASGTGHTSVQLPSSG